MIVCRRSIVLLLKFFHVRSISSSCLDVASLIVPLSEWHGNQSLSDNCKDGAQYDTDNNPDFVRLLTCVVKHTQPLVELGVVLVQNQNQAVEDKNDYNGDGEPQICPERLSERVCNQKRAASDKVLPQCDLKQYSILVTHHVFILK